MRERAKELTAGEGLDVCLDNVGGAMFGTLARLMGWNGRLIPIGFASGEIPLLPMNLPLLKNFSIVGVFTGAWTEKFPDEAAPAADTVMAWVGERKLQPRIDRVLPLKSSRRGDEGRGRPQCPGTYCFAGEVTTAPSTRAARNATAAASGVWVRKRP